MASLRRPISVSSAIEGLRILYPDIPTIPIILAILTALFLMQVLGTSVVGKAFGPLMFIWFLMLGVLGVNFILREPTVLKALNPYYAYRLLVLYPGGFWLLGGVFLCTTGAEALYSDLGHCGTGQYSGELGIRESLSHSQLPGARSLAYRASGTKNWS